MALAKEVKQKLIKEFALNDQDTGSVEVQIALLTENIRLLTDHCQKHAKDFSTKRGLLKMVCQRKSFLNYIAKNNVDQYKKLIGRLGLKR